MNVMAEPSVWTEQWSTCWTGGLPKFRRFIGVFWAGNDVLTIPLERELRKLEKKIYISMMYLFYRGKMNLPSGRSISPGDFVSNRFYVVPNLDIVQNPHTDPIWIWWKWAQASRLDHHTEGTTEIGHMNFLKRNISWLYFYNREEEALKWLEIAVELYRKR